MADNMITYPEPVPIEGYGPGFFRIATVRIDGAVLVLPTSTQSWGGYTDTAPILAAAPDLDVLFVGTGAEIAYLPGALKTTLEEARIGYEPMASPSACRLYNILVSEGRRIGCALLPV
jgi:uncharacterized protein